MPDAEIRRPYFVGCLAKTGASAIEDELALFVRCRHRCTDVLCINTAAHLNDGTVDWIALFVYDSTRNRDWSFVKPDRVWLTQAFAVKDRVDEWLSQAICVGDHGILLLVEMMLRHRSQVFEIEFTLFVRSGFSNSCDFFEQATHFVQNNFRARYRRLIIRTNAFSGKCSILGGFGINACIASFRN